VISISCPFLQQGSAEPQYGYQGKGNTQAGSFRYKSYDRRPQQEAMLSLIITLSYSTTMIHNISFGNAGIESIGLFKLVACH